MMMRTLVLLALSLLPVGPALAEEAAPAKGTLLVASRDLTDPNFAATVVLLIHYDVDGAKGLVLNRPTDVELAELLPGVKGLKRHGGLVWTGGPVAPGGVMMLLRSEKTLPDAVPVVDGVHASHSRELLERLATKRAGKAVFRVYAGYAGWAPGQLDHELARGGWHVMPATAEVVFAEEPARLWRELVPAGPALRAAAGR